MLRVLSVAALAVFFVPAVALAASPKRTVKEPAQVVELFDAIKAGDIEVKVFPKDAKGGTITVQNTTNKPLTIKLPDAFAGVPVAAQVGGGFDAGGGGGMGGGGGNQGFGGGGMGGMGGGMGGMGGMGGGGGFFNVAAEKATKIKYVSVCLDHGKEDPNPRIPYKLVPIESYAKDVQVTEVVKMLVRSELDQHSAQAAAWHLQNGLTWEELFQKIGKKHIGGGTEPYFQPAHLERALLAVKEAGRRAEEVAKEKPESRKSASASESLAKD